MTTLPKENHRDLGFMLLSPGRGVRTLRDVGQLQVERRVSERTLVHTDTAEQVHRQQESERKPPRNVARGESPRHGALRMR